MLEADQNAFEENRQPLHVLKAYACSSWCYVRTVSFRCLSLLVASSRITGVLIGVIVSVTCFVHAVGTYDFPSLSSALGRVFAFFDISVDMSVPERSIVSCLRSQPLSFSKEEFMEAEVFSKMKNMHRRAPVDIEEFIEFYRVQWYARHCHSARHPEADAFVMNVLVCDKPTDTGKLVVGSLVDDTLEYSKPGDTFIAHAVIILYISVPSDMKGGVLELLGPIPHDGVNWSDNLLERIDPKENRMTELRGDSYHQVRGCSTPSNDLRVSLALEQYRVGPTFRDYVSLHVESVKDAMTML